MVSGDVVRHRKPISEDDIEQMMDDDENEQRKEEGRKPVQTRAEKRAAKLSQMQMEDVGYAAVSKALDIIKDKKTRVYSEPAHFTGYWARGTTKMYAMKRPSSEILLFRVMGGQHPMVEIPMSSYDRRSFMLAISKMLGYKSCKMGKNRGFRIYVGKK